MIDQINAVKRDNLAGFLGIEFLEVTDEHVVARMPVVQRVHQPYGILHGGASVVLAETVASVGTWLHIDQQHEFAVGLEINCNHLRAVRSGYVTAEGIPLHRGRSTWVWEIRLRDDQGRLTAISRCTMAVMPQQRELMGPSGV